MRLAWAGLALVVTSGCLVEVDYGGTRFACAVTPVCPTGFECVNQICTPASDAGSSGFRRHLSVSAAVEAPSSAAVRLTPERIDYDRVADGGRDLRFTSSDGQALAHAIEIWDADGESIVWVKLPVLEVGATFSMIYGDGAAGSQRPDEVRSAGKMTEALVVFGELEEL